LYLQRRDRNRPHIQLGIVQCRNEAFVEAHLLTFGQVNLVIGQRAGGFVAEHYVSVVHHVGKQHVDDVRIAADASKCILHIDPQRLIGRVHVLHQSVLRLC